MSAPRPSPLPLPAPGPSAGAGWSWGVLVVLVGALVLVPNLEAGRLHPYDEAAMVDLARRMLDAGRYGFTVGDDGEYALAGFSKPPLALWLIAGSLRLLGANLFAVRLPFALCVLALGALATRWGRRLRPGREGLALGAVWGLLVVLAEGSLRYGGGRACIEPVLALFAASATYAFAHVDGRSARADRGWALLTGLLLGAAFLTKQVAAAMGALPVVGLALLRLRTSPRGAVTSLLLAAVPALAIALGYLMWLEETVGPEALDYLFGFSVVDRMGGFQGIRHFNWLNRFADLVDEVASPVPWALGLLGLVVLATRRRLDGGPAGKDAPGASAFAWGPLLLALTAVLAFDVVSRTVLEWYSFHLVFPLAGGAAFWLVRGTVRLAALRPDDRVDLRGAVELGAGAATALLIVDRSVEDAASRPVVLLVSAALLGLAWRWRSRRAASRGLVGLATVAAVVVVGATAARLARHPHFSDGESRNGSLMRILDEEGAQEVSLDLRLIRKSPRKVRERVAYFGVHSRTGRPPWGGGPPADARVELTPVPTEVTPPPGVRLRRGRGGVVFLGDLSREPVPATAVEDAARRGRITFEAEHLPSGHGWTLQRDPRASGGEARGLKPWLSEKPAKQLLASVPGLTLQAGSYVAVFVLAWRCSGLSGTEKLLELEVGPAKDELLCAAEGHPPPDGYSPVTVPFSLARGGPLDVKATYRRGEVSLDRIEIWPAEVYAKERGRTSERAAGAAPPARRRDEAPPPQVPGRGGPVMQDPPKQGPLKQGPGKRERP